jgi:hypothetical protein
MEISGHGDDMKKQTEEPKELIYRCEKCQGEMTFRHRVNKRATGIDRSFWLCRCGWAVDDSTGEGYWIAK